MPEIVEGIEREEVESSMINSIGWDEMTRTLEVEFTNGDAWQYARVPKEKYDALLEAPSIGRHFLINVRNAYDALKVE